MVDIQGYQILSKIHEGSGTIIYHAQRRRDHLPVIVKILDKTYPSLSELNRFRREYEIVRILDSIPGVIRGYGIEKYQNTLMMLLEYTIGEPLKKRICPNGMPLDEALPIFISITGILGRIHQKNVIHKDLNPSNILMNPSTGEIKIIDFGLSTVLSLENPDIKDPGEIEGSIAYLSPEQTGRMNRSLDYRTDFYSLGVMFYELLTGRLPFTCSDPMEMIHCHIARRPIRACEVNRNVPEVLSDLVTRLMAKSAEERYQSAWGIQHDLRKCLDGLGPTGTISAFPLGLRDIPDKFQLSRKLYGRDGDIDKLMEAFDRAAEGRREMVLVCGRAGIGKSFLAREMNKPVILRKGNYVYGKFDEFHRNVPYSALIDALRDLIRQILTECEAELDNWRNRFFSAFGAHGKLILDVIPEVELIVGPQPPVHELPPTEARDRFNLVFEKFIKTFHRPGRPLAVFLDDLQWADAATLKLVERIMTDETTSYFLLIGAYRDNETGPGHPLTATLNTLERYGVSFDQVTLSRLNLDDICRFVADTLHRSIESVRPLAELVLSRTRGNPFFINQFLSTLVQEELIVFKPSGETDMMSGWVWDMPRIAEMGITENVVDLMIMKLKRLPDVTRQVLLLAACVGNRFDLMTLAAIHQHSTPETFRRLLPAVQQEFVLPASDLSVAGDESENGGNQLLVYEYVFSHNRVRQAVYEMLSESKRCDIHYRIAKQFLESMSEEEKKERIFDLAAHLNLGSSLITSNAEKCQLAGINLRACKRAIDATAYASAVQYCKQGLSALSGIETDFRELTLELLKQGAVCEYLNGNYAQLEKATNRGLALASSAVEKAAFYGIFVIKSTMLGEHEAAVEYARTALALLNIDLPKDDFQAAIERECTQVKTRLGDRPIQSLIDAPEMVQPDKIAAMQIFNNLTPAAYFCHPRLYAWMCAKMASLSLAYGHTLESGKGYTSFGNVLCAETGDCRAGYEFGMLGLRLCEKINHISYQCRSCFVITAFLTHWVRPIREAERLGEQGHRVGLESGELLYVGYILAFNDAMNAFYRGKNLSELMADLEQNLLFVKKTNNRLAIDVISVFKMGVEQLMGRATWQLSVDTDEIDGESGPESGRAQRSLSVVGFWYVQKAMLFNLYGNPSAALHWACQAKERMAYISGTLSVVMLNFHHSLALAALLPDAAPAEKPQYLRQLEANQKQMKTWVDSCPENFLHLYLLVAAEMARTSGDWSAAADLYDEALASASEFGFIQNEALANELAGKFWLGRGKKKIAGLYMAEALYAYHLWGAEHKAADLEAKVPFVSAKSGGSASTSTSSGIGQSLDVMAVVKAAQVISGEIRLKNLVEKVMDIVMKNAGAENGALILKKDKSLIVEARVFEEDPRKTFFTSVSLGECDSLSLSIIRYVARTRENVVLHDAAADAMFGQDPHILKTRPRSILSIPILRHRELSGILYLENNKMVGAFTPERVEVLQLLAAQAAISIENAKLYTTYRSLYDNAIEGMFQSTPLGRYLTCNPAMARILGYDSPEDLIESMTDIRQQLYYNPNDRYRFTDMLDRDGRAIGFETRFLRKDGTPIWVSESARKVCDSLGNVLYYEGTVLDITARKEKEESERQREIAVRSTQAKSEFLANMSHEIRTPMNAIIGLAYLAQKTELTLKQKDYVVKIENAAQSLLGIINDILDFSKIEAGKLDLETIGFDLAEVLEQLSSLISPKASEKEVELLFDIAPDVPYALEGDPVRLGQILINLVNNAIKFTEAGQILVKAEAMEPLNESEDSRVSLKFSVKDTGIGMTEKQMAGLFRPFFQADGSSTRKYGGTGLGLTICKQLVEMMDGEIWVESEPGEGSVFSFFVRLGKQTSAAARSLAPPGLAGRRVLVVDDNPTSREIVAAILVSFSLDVMQASSVKEAFSELRAADPASPIELVFMDYKMPEMNGVEAIKYIRNELLLTHQPAIVMLTAYGSEDVMEKARLINIDGYLVKPVHPSLLFDTVMDTLDGRISREISEFKATDMDAQSLKQVSGAKVLLVEDNAINQQVASEILAQFGLQVSIANNGLEALKAFELSAFDLVLMDIQMPALDGYRASKAIRTMEKTRGGATDRIPIVAMTAHAMAGEREKCLDAGMDDHIAKPIDPALLFDKIVHWIAPDRIKAGQAAPKRGNVDAFEFPPHLPGIDLEAGISRLMGNTAVYRALLLNFKEKYSTIDDDIATSVGKGDFIKARQLIHLVRGVAGNLGADALYRAASDFEAAAVKGDTDNAAPLISDFREKLGQVLHSINSIDIKPKVKADASVPTAHEELDLKAVETALKACDDLLTSDFLEAMSRVEALNRLLQHTAVRETVRQLEAQMGEFNINGARESLREIARNLNISLEDP